MQTANPTKISSLPSFDIPHKSLKSDIQHYFPDELPLSDGPDKYDPAKAYESSVRRMNRKYEIVAEIRLLKEKLWTTEMELLATNAELQVSKTKLQAAERELKVREAEIQINFGARRESDQSFGRLLLEKATTVQVIASDKQKDEGENLPRQGSKVLRCRLEPYRVSKDLRLVRRCSRRLIKMMGDASQN
ncbi:hypothetical protein AOL_s00091g38 [Orbilia oligospora ATCC 24927]|uniref:Uncharacterized protein n=1 Tax=Arthrobotrys oligospora (strain ATCC 24927 / CBS 115.81 / DSM 1491) TaxID=756982 RepID=G1XHY6_ARTOA|nr:hypothetical protein AOL_s00091g38 [Orbilia oligospora ATCC 24927]EGX47217.1 hypothetical protein AOL_s00091g38 [Orbilia oligospora ATCC 24927]